MDELANAKDGFLRLTNELVEEVFFRLPPSEPSHLVRASAVRKRWRQILADAGFRRRYREFHGTPPVLGLFQEDTSFVPTSAPLPALPDHWRSRWKAMKTVDCRHGRALITPYNRYFGDFGEGEPFDLTVLDPLTGYQHRVPCPDNDVLWFSAAVLCAAAQGCDHLACQGGDFLVAFVTTDQQKRVTSGWLYSSETRKWSEFAPVHHPNVSKYTFNQYVPSVLVGDALYFNIDGVIKCDLGTLRLSMFERPTDVKGRLMTAEDGGLGFAAVLDVTNLTLWSSMETGPEGAMGWAKLRVIDLTMLLANGALSVPAPECVISCIAQGSQVIFISTSACYMVDLKTGRVRKVAPPGRKFFPYMSFYMPAMEAASTGQGQ